jgi:glycosyltransferase involved in cell wall biosynthesis
MPKISILLAVYNGESKLRETLNCLLQQTLKDIEIVCVNDASTDGSLQILQEYAKDDGRFVLVSSDENRGTVYTRKTGVNHASGKYLMFMDQDDFFEPETCEELYEAIVDKDVDVLHFRSRVIAVPPTTESQRIWYENFMKPYDGYLFGEEVFFGSYGVNPKRAWNLYTWVLWNKIYRADVCKLAMKECAEDYVIHGDDLYVYMLIAFYAKSYYGDANGKSYHRYSLGAGLMGGHKLSLKTFRRICQRGIGVKNGQKFLLSKGPDPRYTEILDLDYSRFLRGIVEHWYKRVNAMDQSAAFDMMCDYLPSEELIAGICRDIKAPVHKILACTAEAKHLAVTRTEVKAIGIYCPKRPEAGSSVSALIYELQRQGHRVVIFLEQKEDGYICELPLVFLPSEQKCNHYGRPLKQRMEVLRQSFKDVEIDAFIISGCPTDHYLADFLMAKSCGIPVISEATEITEVKNHLLTLLYADALISTDEKSQRELDYYRVDYVDLEHIGELPDRLRAKQNYTPLILSLQLGMQREILMGLKEFVADERTQRAFNLETIWQDLRNGGIGSKIKLIFRLLKRQIRGGHDPLSKKELNRYAELEDLTNRIARYL